MAESKWLSQKLLSGVCLDRRFESYPLRQGIYLQGFCNSSGISKSNLRRFRNTNYASLRGAPLPLRCPGSQRPDFNALGVGPFYLCGTAEPKQNLIGLAEGEQNKTFFRAVPATSETPRESQILRSPYDGIEVIALPI